MSNAYNIFTGNALDPRETVHAVYTIIASQLRSAPKSEDAKTLYLKQHPERYSYGGTVRFDADEITDITARDNSIVIEFGKNKPCGRGCCSDWISDKMTIPDDLIAAYEKTQEGVYAEPYFDDAEATEAFNVLIKAHVKLLVTALESKAVSKKIEAAAKLEREETARRLAQEAHDRAEFERLREKFA